MACSWWLRSWFYGAWFSRRLSLATAIDGPLRRHFSTQDSQNINRRLDTDPPVGCLGQRRDMWRDDGMRMPQQRVVRRRRLLLKHVGGKAADPPLTQRILERPLIDDCAAGRIDQQRAGPHGLEC